MSWALQELRGSAGLVWCLLPMAINWEYRHRERTCLAELEVIGRESVGARQKTLMP